MPRETKRDIPEIAETQALDLAFLTNLENTMTDARRIISGVVKDWAILDPQTKNERMQQLHSMVAVDLYERIKSLCEPRGHLTDFEWDVGTMVEETLLVPMTDPTYEAVILQLHTRLLARYQFWMDRMGILLQNRPPELFAISIIESMEEEFAIVQESETLRQRMVEARAAAEERVKRVMEGNEDAG